MKGKFTALFLLLLSFRSFGDKLEKGFERLKVYDYFSAKQYFEKAMDNDPSAASFGLASIYSVSNNPFYNTDSARKYILISDSIFHLEKERVRKYYAELGVTDTTIEQLSNKICSDAFSNVQKIGSSAAYNHFISYYNSCSETEYVIQLRNQAAFSEADSANTSEAFKRFMSAYPTAAQFADAHKKYDELIYRENTDGTIDSYLFFIQAFPESPYRKQAEKMIYNLSVPDHSISQYAAFARTYPNSSYSRDAWQQVYRIGMQNFSESAYNKFKTDYPDYPYADELEADYKLQNTFLLPFSENEKYGYINDTGAVMIEPQFNEAALFSEGLAVVSLDNKYGFINKAGKLVIGYNYDDAEPFHNSASVILKDSLYGLIDKKGSFLINPSFEELSEADGSLYMGVKNGLSGYVTRSGDSITSFSFDVSNDFMGGYAIVSKDEKFSLVDSTGKIIAGDYDDLVFISDRLLKAMNDDEKWAIIDVNGDTLLPFDYEAIGDFSENRAMVVLNGKCGFIDQTRMLVIPAKYPFLPNMLTTGKFENGFALLKQKFRSVLIDSSGTVIHFKGVEDYGRPSLNFYPVRKNSRWGFANSSGRIVIPCKYQSAESFINGLSVIMQNKFFGVIDTSGIEIIPPQYSDIVIRDSSILVKSTSGYGLFSLDGAMIIPCEFETIEFIRSDLAKASSKVRYQIVNLSTGKVIRESGQ